MRYVAWVALLASTGFSAVNASAQQGTAYPSKPIRLIVPLAPGGATDLTARTLAHKLGEQMKQTIVVENRAGASGIIGNDFVAKSAPDGYTLLLAQASTAAAAALFPKLPYDTLRDLQAISQLTQAPYVLTVHPSLPVHSVSQLIALAKARPGELNHASAGSATGPHLAMELLMQRVGAKVTHVPYKGAGPATVDFIAGHTQVYMSSIVTMQPHIKAGKVRALASSGAQRSHVMPDLPTIAEAGLAGYNEGASNGLMAPAGVSKDILEKLHAEVVRAMRTPEVAQRLQSEGAEIVASTPDEYAARIRADVAKWIKVVKLGGLKPD